MKDLSITEFRRQCLSLLDALPDEGVIITKRGEPLARILPIHRTRRGERVQLPLLKGKGRRGPACPDTETPYDLVFD
jgi:prevent-host-death family protein